MGVVLVVGGLGLAACSAGTGSGAGPTSTTTVATTHGSAASVQNLLVTTQVRSDLVAAGAAAHGLPGSDYVGLQPGTTYYAFDHATSTYWAGAALQPDPSSVAAQVSAQDDGAYLLFTRPAGGNWTVYDVGLAGVGTTPCPVAVPAPVLAVWDWPAASCRPVNI